MYVDRVHSDCYCICCVVDSTPCQNLTISDTRNNDQLTKQNAQRVIEPCQTIPAPLESGANRYGLEASQDPTDSTKKEGTVCLEENSVPEKRKYTAVTTASPDGTVKQPKIENELNAPDNPKIVSMVDQSHMKVAGGLKESSSTKDQTVHSGSQSGEPNGTFPFKSSRVRGGVKIRLRRNKIIFVIGL